MFVRPHRRRLPVEEVVANAESRLGSDGYHLVWNNCEHFAIWASRARPRANRDADGWRRVREPLRRSAPLKPPEYMNLAGPWVDGKDPAG